MWYFAYLCTQIAMICKKERDENKLYKERPVKKSIASKNDPFHSERVVVVSSRKTEGYFDEKERQRYFVCDIVHSSRATEFDNDNIKSI